MRRLGFDPVEDTRETFRSLCRAMSRPGTIETVPSPADHAVLATLVDHEVSLTTTDTAVTSAFEEAGRLTEASPSDADILHAIGTPEWDVREASRGTLIEPSEGATVVYHVEQLDRGPKITLSGPGVPEARQTRVGLPAEEIARLQEAQSSYPRGVDAIVAAGRRLVALPRSVTLDDGTTADVVEGGA